MSGRLPRFFFYKICTKSSAANGRRKWSSRAAFCQGLSIVTATALICPPVEQAGAGAVPLPRPRPAAAPSAPPGGGTPPKQPVTQAETEAAPQPSACRTALTEAVAIASSIPDIHGPGGCGGEDLVRLEAVVLPDHHRVAVSPPAILRCPMASAVAGWVRSDIAPLAQGLGSAVTELDNFDAFECRSRNRVIGATLSEHGRANALDVRSFKFANGRTISLTDRAVPRDVREAILHSACTRFTTVLGPGSDGYHEDHVHLDLMQRNNDYRICQWSVWDPLPAVAPMLPASRPADAPPRPVADTPGNGKPDLEADDDARPPSGNPEKPPTKKRR